MIKAAAAKIIEILKAAAGGTTKTCQQELQEAEKNIKAAAARVLKAAAAGKK